MSENSAAQSENGSDGWKMHDVCLEFDLSIDATRDKTYGRTDEAYLYKGKIVPSDVLFLFENQPVRSYLRRAIWWYR